MKIISKRQNIGRCGCFGDTAGFYAARAAKQRPHMTSCFILEPDRALELDPIILLWTARNNSAVTVAP